MFLKAKFIGIATLLLPWLVMAQEQPGPPMVKNPPIMMEVMAGNRAFAYQMIVNKKTRSVSRLGFFGVTNFQPEWGNPKINDYMLQGNLTYGMLKGLDITAGFIWNPIDGIRPSAGVMYTYANPTWLAVVNPRVDVSRNANADILGLIEYKPGLSEKVKLYTRLQGLYTRNLSYDMHIRSYVMLRAGVSIKDVTLGIANNMDFYGPAKRDENNFGGFILVNLF